MFRNLLHSAAAIAAFGLLGFSQVARAQDCDGGCCNAGCCKTGCTSVPNVKKVKVHCYNDVCQDLCVPGCDLHQLCSGLFKGWHCVDYCGCHGNAACESGCGDCAEGKCKKVHCQQKFLVVKVRTHEETGRKCVSDSCPAGSACTTLPMQMAPPPPPGKGPEAIPAPKGNPGAGEVQRPLPLGPAMSVNQ
jgi:hypothetical protein